MGNNWITVEVAYAWPGQQTLIEVKLQAGSTIEAAIERSGILMQCPEINLAVQEVGIFSRLCQLSDEVFNGDRIEIYRPLIIDPKEARRAKAKKSLKRTTR